MTTLAPAEQIEAPLQPAYALADETFDTAEAFAAQHAFELGGDYSTDASDAEYVGPIGALAMVLNAPREPAEYQQAFDERSIPTLKLVAAIAYESLDARAAEIRAAGAKVAGFFARVRDALSPVSAEERHASEGVIALAAGSAATRNAIML